MQMPIPSVARFSENHLEMAVLKCSVRESPDEPVFSFSLLPRAGCTALDSTNFLGETVKASFSISARPRIYYDVEGIRMGPRMY